MIYLPYLDYILDLSFCISIILQVEENAEVGNEGYAVPRLYRDLLNSDLTGAQEVLNSNKRNYHNMSIIVLCVQFTIRFYTTVS